MMHCIFVVFGNLLIDHVKQLVDLLDSRQKWVNNMLLLHVADLVDQPLDLLQSDSAAGLHS